MLRVVLAMAAGVVLVNWATPASACSVPRPPPALVGGPVDGDTDVPTDVVPFYEAPAAWIDINSLASHAVQFVLTSPSGDVIRTSADRSHVWTFALTPETLLAPHTTYTLRGTWNLQIPNGGSTSADMALVFTTGAGPVTELPPAPVARLQHYQIVNTPLTSCSPSKAGSCVAFAVGLPVEASLFVAGSDAAIGFFGPQLYHGPFFTDLAGIMQGTPADCVRLRSRAPNGKTSDPTDLCRDDGPVLTLMGSDRIGCTSQGITHGLDGGLVPTTDGSTAGTTGDGSPGGPSGDVSHSGASCAVSTGRCQGGKVGGTLVTLALGGLLRHRGQNRRKIRAV